MKSLNTYLTEALDGSKMTYSGKNRDFVDVILEDPEGKILILRRANYMKNFRTCWGVIGGAVDVADKTLKDAAVRETAEETGISLSFNEVNNMKQLFDYKYKDGNVSHVFWTRLETKIDKVKISREHSKYEWIDFNNEKIDERKWMPEVFNILQKWEQRPVNEKLLINKNFKSANDHLDTLINTYVIHWMNDNILRNGVRGWADIDLRLGAVLFEHNITMDQKIRNNIIYELAKHINIKSGECYVFYSGDAITNKKFNSVHGNSTDVNDLIKHIDRNDVNMLYNNKYTNKNKDSFEAFWIDGAEVQLISFGSTWLRVTYISPNK